MNPTDIAAAARHHWWLFVLRGAVGIIFGLLMLMRPGVSVVAVLVFVAAYALVDGIVTIGSAFRLKQLFDRWWVLLVQGLIGVAFGVLAFMQPALSLLYIVISVSLWMVFAAGAQFMLARAQRAMGAPSFWPTLGGILSLLLAVMALAYPGRTILLVVAFIAWFALIGGAVQIMVALRVRSLFARMAPA